MGARPSSIIHSMRACASRTLEIALRGRIVNYSRRAQLFRTAESTPLYRPVGAYGNNWAVSPDRHAKSLRTKGFGGRYSVNSLVTLLYSDAETAPGGTRQYQNASSEASFRYSHSMASVLTFRHSSCTQFSVPPRAEYRQVTPCRVSSALGTKSWDNFKTHFKLSALSFLFCPKGHCGASFVLGSAENARFETQPPL